MNRPSFFCETMPFFHPQSFCCMYILSAIAFHSPRLLQRPSARRVLLTKNSGSVGVANVINITVIRFKNEVVGGFVVGCNFLQRDRGFTIAKIKQKTVK
jgi:hypothetical protein